MYVCPETKSEIVWDQKSHGSNRAGGIILLKSKLFSIFPMAGCSTTKYYQSQHRFRRFIEATDTVLRNELHAQGLLYSKIYQKFSNCLVHLNIYSVNKTFRMPLWQSFLFLIPFPPSQCPVHYIPCPPLSSFRSRTARTPIEGLLMKAVRTDPLNLETPPLWSHS